MFTTQPPNKLIANARIPSLSCTFAAHTKPNTQTKGRKRACQPVPSPPTVGSSCTFNKHCLHLNINKGSTQQKLKKHKGLSGLFNSGIFSYICSNNKGRCYKSLTHFSSDVVRNVSHSAIS